MYSSIKRYKSICSLAEGLSEIVACFCLENLTIVILKYTNVYNNLSFFKPQSWVNRSDTELAQKQAWNSRVAWVWHHFQSAPLIKVYFMLWPCVMLTDPTKILHMSNLSRNATLLLWCVTRWLGYQDSDVSTGSVLANVQTSGIGAFVRSLLKHSSLWFWMRRHIFKHMFKITAWGRRVASKPITELEVIITESSTSPEQISK